MGKFCLRAREIIVNKYQNRFLYGRMVLFVLKTVIKPRQEQLGNMFLLGFNNLVDQETANLVSPVPDGTRELKCSLIPFGMGPEQQNKAVY